MRPITIRDDHVYVKDWDEDDDELRDRFVGLIEDGEFKPGLCTATYLADDELVEVRRRIATGRLR